MPLPADLHVGDVLACTSTANRQIEVTIGKIDDIPRGVRVVSVSLKDKAPNATLPVAGHLPFEIGVLRASCPTLVGHGTVEPGLFDEGYRMWRDAFDNGHGGYFTISVDQAIDFAIKAMREGAQSQ